MTRINNTSETDENIVCINFVMDDTHNHNVTQNFRVTKKLAVTTVTKLPSRK